MATSIKSSKFFSGMARTMKVNSINTTNKNKKFDFDSLKECKLFLIKLYIKQGGRCAYSNIPIYPERNHKYKLSPERIDPTKSYNKDNIVLIVIGLNGSPAGQWLNEDLSEQQHQIALKSGIFNQDYWNSCTKITPEIIIKMDKAREYGFKILSEKIKFD